MKKLLEIWKLKGSPRKTGRVSVVGEDGMKYQFEEMKRMNQKVISAYLGR